MICLWLPFYHLILKLFLTDCFSDCHFSLNHWKTLLPPRWKETDKTHRNRVWDLQQQLDRQKKQEESIVRSHQETKGLIQRFFPGVLSALPAIRDCIKVKMPDNLITMLLDGKPRSFKSGATLYDPDEKKDVDVGDVEVQIKQDPTDAFHHQLLPSMFLL